MFSGCSTKKEDSELNISALLQNRYDKLLNYEIDSLAFPRSYSYKDKLVKKVFKLLLELKKEGRINKSTPII